MDNWFAPPRSGNALHVIFRFELAASLICPAHWWLFLNLFCKYHREQFNVIQVFVIIFEQLKKAFILNLVSHCNILSLKKSGQRTRL